MKKNLIVLTNEDIEEVNGGCACYCYDPHNAGPDTCPSYEFDAWDSTDCNSGCIRRGMMYHHCN